MDKLPWKTFNIEKYVTDKGTDVTAFAKQSLNLKKKKNLIYFAVFLCNFYLLSNFVGRLSPQLNSKRVVTTHMSF